LLFAGLAWLVAAPGLEVLGGMAGSGGLLEPSGLDADAAAPDVAGMAPPGIAFAGLAPLPLAPTFVAHALAVVLLDWASAVALGMEMLDAAAAAPAVGVLLLDTSASWSDGTSSLKTHAAFSGQV
jgi:hypothetical protein